MGSTVRWSRIGRAIRDPEKERSGEANDHRTSFLARRSTSDLAISPIEGS
jgi:hypothetical protein